MLAASMSLVQVLLARLVWMARVAEELPLQG